MSSIVNEAFATPKSDVSGSTMGNNSTITNGVVNQLKRTRPWVLFLSIIGFLFTALMAIGTLGIFFGGGAAILSGTGQGGAGASGMIMGMGLVYLLMTALYFFASLYLLKYAGSIKKVVNSGSSQDLEMALKAQASFWKLVGILSLVMVAFMLIALVLGVGSAMIGL